MPIRGMLSSKVPTGSTSEDRAFADKLRAAYELLPPRNMRYLAALLAVHASTLSKYLSGSRRPGEPTVETLYRLAAEHQRREFGRVMPFPLEDLLCLLQEAVASRAGHRRRAPVPSEEAAGTAALPPVPSQRADRQDGAADWDGSATVEALQKAGQLQAAHLLLTETGRTASPEAVCAAAAALRLRGLGDAADTLLLATGQRSDRERTAILAALNRGRRFHDIEAVLRAAEYLLEAAA